MENELGKKALLSGKLTGTRTLQNELSSIKEPDEIEQFFQSFYNLKLSFDTKNQLVYINDDQDFNSNIIEIEKSEFVSIYTTPNFSRLYITTDNKTTYVIRLSKIDHLLISSFIAKEKPIKFALNSFSFIKWCITQKIDIRNIFDIPTFIKLLTNDIDPFKSINNYIEEYSSYTLVEDDNETNCIIIGNFIYEFGKFLNNYIIQFNLMPVCKLINENTYAEANIVETIGSCKITFSYKNLDSVIENIVKSKNDVNSEHAYILSPLNRIAIKFGNKIDELAYSLFLEDLSISLLNDLYSNNLKPFSMEDGSYKLICKYKNLGNVISILTAILNDTFYTFFNQSAEIQLSCDITE